MKKYTIHFQGQKIRLKRHTAGAGPELVDEWEQTIQSDGPPAIWQLTDFVFPRQGIAGIRFYRVPSQPGLFRTTQVEDRVGRYNSKGHYLAQVDVQITASLNRPTVPVGTLNRPALPD